MKHWPTWIVALASLALSGSMWLSGDRLGVERRVTALEGQAAANQQALDTIREDVREIRRFLLGGK